MIETSLLQDLIVYSIQVACVVTGGAALAGVIRIDAPGVRYAYWRALLALCLILPWLQARRSVVLPVASMPASASWERLGAATGAASMPMPLDWMAIVAWVLVAGAIVRGCRTGVGLWRLRRLRHSGRLAPVCRLIEDAQDLVRARAEIRYVAHGQPVTFGFRRPVVLLPEMLRSQSEGIQRVVLCHELFHVRRRDWIWVVAEEAVKVVLWFHPAVWWLIARVRQAREEVVDELTVLATAERRAYLEALLVFADAPTETPAAAFARRRHLFRRIVLISKEAVMSSRRIVASVAVMAVVLAAGVVATVSVFPLTQVVSAQGRTGGPGAIAAAGEAGPLERQAKPITPENPIPRRTYSVAPQNPGDDSAGVVLVSVRVVLDRLGRVGEARGTGVGSSGGRGGATPAPGVLTPPGEAFVKAAVDAVRQWQYEPPADGPIAFDVSFVFSPGQEPRLMTHGAPGIRFAPPPPPSPPAPGTVAAPPPPPPPPVPPELQGAIRVGDGLAAPRKVRHVAPVYPAIAQSARVQGVVIAELIVDHEGRVGYARILRSIPLLDQAALDALQQWEFTPTMLNGSPVPVIMTVTVQFTLT